MQNPWKGLAAYKEPKPTDDYTYLFCGRESASAKLAELIESSLFVTLYGRTGIGKTSLLEAGVYPLLRNSSYIPVSVRLGIHDESQSAPFARLIVDAIESEIKDIRQTTDTGLKDTDVNFLWEYFATRHFFIDGSEVYPTIVLDQFEENFISASEKTWTLLRQLYSLIDDNKTFPEGYHSETIFRIVISIREDDLFRMEDCIDQLHLTDFKFNRYRLTYLTASEASEVITVPGGQYLPGNSQERQKVVSEILKIVKDGNDGCINTLTLSLVCSILFDKISTKGRSVISFEDVTEIGRNPLRDFYLSIVSGIPRQRHFIENRLVDSNGRRNSVNEQEMDTAFPNWRAFLSGRQRILQCSNHKVELIHDMLAKAIYDVRQKKESKKKKLLLQKYVIIFIFSLLVISAFSSVFSIRGKNGKVPLFPIKELKVQATYNLPAHIKKYVEKLTIENSNDVIVTIGDLLSLRNAVITNDGRNVIFENCPELKSIEVLSDIRHLIVRNCPHLETILIHNSIGSIDSKNQQLNVIPVNSSQYEWFDNILWDINKQRVVYATDERHEANFPYSIRNLKYIIASPDYTKDTIFNTANWIDGILFDRHQSTIIASSEHTDTIIDFRKYKSLRQIQPYAFYGRDIREIILKSDLNYGEYAFGNCLSLRKIIVLDTNTALPHYGSIYNTGEIQYVIKDSSRYCNRHGIIYEQGLPVRLSSEYVKPYYAYYSDSTAKIFFHGGNLRIEKKPFFHHYTSEGKINLESLLEIQSPYITGSPLLWNRKDFEGNTYLFGEIIEQCSNDLYLPHYLGYFDCTNLNHTTKSIHITNSSFNSFTNLPDTLRAKITLFVPYGQYKYLPANFKGFKSIEEESLFNTIFNTLCSIFYDSKSQLRNNRPAILSAILGIIAVIVIFSWLSYLRSHRIVNVIKDDILMIITAIICWTVFYWFCMITLDTNSILSTVIAAVFTLIVLLALFYNLLYVIKLKKHSHSIND